MNAVDEIVSDLAEQPEDELGELVQQAHRVLMKHPFASRAAFRALVAEGRRFASTPEGARWKERLRGSEIVQRGRSIWEIATAGMLDPSAAELPSHFVDLVSYALTTPDFEPRLARAAEPTLDDAGAEPSRALQR